MGWSYGWNSKKELLEHIEGDNFYTPGYKAIKHRTIGNNHWTLLETPEGERTISLELLSSYQGEWGYKGLDESMGPVETNCPLSLLNQATPTTDKWALEWRENVRAEHKTKSERPEYQAGQVWKHGNGNTYELLRSAGKRKGWVANEIETGSIYRLPFTHLSRATLVA